MTSGVRRPPAVLAALVLLCWVAPTLAQEITTAQRDSRTRVLIDGDMFCDLVAGNDSPYGELSRPMIYPIYGPTGAMMTRHYPMRDDVEAEEHDHPHHRSLWFAHGDVNGVDFWTEGEGRGYQSNVNGFGPARHIMDGTGLSLALRSYWRHASVDEEDNWHSQNLLYTEQSYGFVVLDDGSRVIDFGVRMQVTDEVESVTFGDTKEGTMAIRTHPALRLVGEHATGQAVNSEGDTGRDLWGKRAKWVAYWGTIDGETCGVAIFDHPENLRHPTWWHARDYGLIAANPFGIHDFENKEPGTGDYTLQWGETLALRYRFVFFAGDAEQADIAGKYEAWVAETTEDEAEDAHEND